MRRKVSAPNAGERGFALIFAVGTVAMLMAGAMIMLVQAANYAEIVGASKNRQKVAFVNDAGVAQGKADLFNIIHPLGPQTFPTLAFLRLRPPVPRGHTLCADGADCLDFHFITAPLGLGTSFGGGSYEVAVSCFPRNCWISDGDLVGFEMRVLSTLPGGAQKLVEVTLLP